MKVLLVACVMIFVLACGGDDDGSSGQLVCTDGALGYIEVSCSTQFTVGCNITIDEEQDGYNADWVGPGQTEIYEVTCGQHIVRSTRYPRDQPNVYGYEVINVSSGQSRRLDF